MNFASFVRSEIVKDEEDFLIRISSSNNGDEVLQILGEVLESSPSFIKHLSVLYLLSAHCGNQCEIMRSISSCKENFLSLQRVSVISQPLVL